jgi:hypothetical protein
MAPEISFDGSRYHLGLVSRYSREHGFHPITDNFYAAFPEAVEMLYLFAFAFGRHSAASVVHFLFLLALVWQMYAWSRRRGFPFAGACGAALVFLSPAVGVDATSAYNDVAVAAIVFTLFHVMELWGECDSGRLLASAGLLAGFGCAAKYTAFPAVLYAIGYVVWKRGHSGSAWLVAGLAALGIAPWILKNYLWFHNPFAPFFNQLFPNPYFTPAFEREYSSSLLLYGLHSRWEIPLQLAIGGSLSGLLGPVFLAAPLGLAALRWPEGRRLLLAAGVFGSTWLLNISVRFLLPALPFAALAMCLVMAQAPRVAMAVIFLHAVLSWPDAVRRYCRPDAWHLAKVTHREALRIKPEEGYLESNLPYYGATRMIEQSTPPGASVFTETPIPEAYTSRRILVGYQSAANVVSRRVWYSGFVPEHAPVERLRFDFPAQAVRAFRLIQTVAASATWTLHEVRAFDGNDEIPRAGWRATARPTTWGLDAAIDGRASSLWMSGDSIRPGQFAQFDLDMPRRVDAVVVEAAPDQPGSRVALELETADRPGEWTRVSWGAQVTEKSSPANLRGQAAEELRRRGIDYLLIFDGQFGARDLRDRQQLWGIREVAEYKGATLYRLR